MQDSQENVKKILCVCDQGNNRSVTFAHLLKYKGYETLSAGLQTNSPETLELLFMWADFIIITAVDQVIPAEFVPKVILMDVGPDTYPRPFNKELYSQAKWLINKWALS